MRGKVCALLSISPADRITPACAGKRKKLALSALFARDHPRMCGEKGLPTLRYSPQSGSPPHVRGKGQSILPLHQRNGITPRMCGEKSGYSGLRAWVRGSPPRMRGKAIHGLALGVHAGITPACAGKRSGPSPAAVPAGPAGSCPASRPSQFPPRMTVISPRP